jgi:hypothetical protein
VEGFREEIPEKPVPGVIAMWNAGELIEGSDVFVTWRSKENTSAKLVTVSPDKSYVVVRLTGQVDERRLAPDKVYVDQIVL